MNTAAMESQMTKQIRGTSSGPLADSDSHRDVGAKLSPTMQEALNVARVNGGRLERLPGGFWTYPGCPCDERAVPNWYVSAHTVKALLARGYVEDDEFASNRGGKYMVGVRLAANATMTTAHAPNAAEAQTDTAVDVSGSQP